MYFKVTPQIKSDILLMWYCIMKHLVTSAGSSTFTFFSFQPVQRDILITFCQIIILYASYYIITCYKWQQKGTETQNIEFDWYEFLKANVSCDSFGLKLPISNILCQYLLSFPFYSFMAENDKNSAFLGSVCRVGKASDTEFRA